MTIWEYCILTAIETSEQQTYTLSTEDGPRTPRSEDRLAILMDLGREGWELVTVRPLAVGITEFYFKRS